MVWGLAAALAAGVTRHYSYLWFLIVLSLFSLLLPKRVRLRAILILATASLLFLYGHHYARTIQAKQHFAQRFLTAGGSGTRHTLKGWVCDYPETRGARTAFRFRTRLDEMELDLLVYSTMPGIAYGESLSIQVKPPRWRRGDRTSGPGTWLFAGGLAAVVTADPVELHRLAGCSGSWIKRRLFWPLHDHARRTLVRTLGAKSGIPLALLLGEKGQIDKSTKRTFIRLGISHLFALSGMHLGLIAGAILICFRFLRVKSRLTLLLLLSLYVGTVGDVVSLHRAYTMAALLIAASLFHRPLNLLSALGNAVFLILIWWPHMIYSVAFQLSCLATFAVILSIRRFNIPRGRNLLGKLRSYAASTLIVSAFVQVFVVPLLIHHFGYASVVSPIATLIFFPFVLAVLFLSLFCVLLGAISSSAGSLIAVVLCPLVDVFQSLLQRASELAPSPVHFPKADILLYCAGLTLAWSSKGRSAKTLIGLVLVGIAFLKSLVLSG